MVGVTTMESLIIVNYSDPMSFSRWIQYINEFLVDEFILSIPYI